MLEHIYDTNDEFPFSKINISKPVSLPGGNHFIKFTLNDMPVYVSPPKCNLKSNPFLRTEENEPTKKMKRTNCDFIFSQEHDDFLRWIENLEEFAQNKIFENRNRWFESTLEQEDIQNSFTSPLKVIKSGKQYLLRVSIPQTKTGDRNGFKIFNHNEEELSFDDIDEMRHILCVLEIRGIKFSSKYFQIEIDVKQLMALKPVVDLFEKCVLLKKTVATENVSVEPSFTIKPIQIKESENNHEPKEIQQNSVIDTQDEVDVNGGIEIEFQDEDRVNLSNETSSQIDIAKIEPNIQNNKPSQINGLDEIELDLDNISTDATITLKQRNDVYYEMYVEARRKAKIARDLALSAYLEARRIKNTYMLNDIMESEDEDESDMEELEELDELDELENKLENK